MLKHKFDLCANEVTLDYDALIHVSRTAMRYSLMALSERLHGWYDPEPRLTNLDAQRLVDDAESLANATVAYHYLVEGLTRDEIKARRGVENAKVSEL